MSFDFDFTRGWVAKAPRPSRPKAVSYEDGVAITISYLILFGAATVAGAYGLRWIDFNVGN